ncbi:TetR family transcriptional regulator [Amycolatopsis mediterranei S699]|uniref:TetR family transcriptional regulator n=2 Tax=Amycolatopsis mediterranei TaxID=33910 RepID=A0A0H3CX70_AMYMU|nr:TetR/AcrR family transcriptional regulator [Amycolatopsis mediterranei]ADJ42928.1 TetR family transcriptional regulator [Amycolatopsis mediterranei U32]AEK39623.1 TetR family transcriptional regulator [Amycolatopsis mediterranei S699]AFO74642.1 TetR family transcriptional regulator [Amycolatopsis mediterranei S699]AGT81771.1 TetR family transcriptional regulator [Amycolatopsis mediterranei RB]KDO04404.1 TetR family transcriptional regulator [Amycolatopsis mediterranei]
MTLVIERVKRSSKQAGKSSRSEEATGDARRDRWRKHRIARRKEFVEAALRALDTHGPDLGMEDVAAEAGVTKPVLYRHFDDKADLYVALGQRGTEILFERLIPAINAELAPVPRIRMALDAFFTVIEEHPNLYRLLAHGRPEKPVSSDVVAEDKELIATALTALLGDYMRMFNMDSGAAEPWAHGIVGMVQNTGEWWLDRRSMSRDAVVEYLTQIIWAAIDGLTRQNGVVIDPNLPLEANKVVQLGRAPESLEETS